MEAGKLGENTFNQTISSHDQNPEISIKSKSFFKTFLKILLILVLAALLFVGGFVLGSRGRNAAVNKATSLNKLMDPQSPLFANFLGSVNGQIVQITGNQAYVQTVGGGKGIFEIPDQVFVANLGNNPVSSMVSKDQIQLNRNAIIKLSAIGNAFVVTAITYDNGNSVSNFNINDASASGSN